MNRTFKRLLPVLATAAVIALCLWLPSLFLTPPSEIEAPPETEPGSSISISTEVLGVADRLALWRAFQDKAEGYYSRSEDLDFSALGFDAKLDESLPNWKSLGMFFLDNREESVQAEKVERVVFYDAQGRAIRMLHFFRQWTGDWRNWLVAYVDEDTYQIYYLYVSSGCEGNYDSYRGALDTDYTAESAAELWAEIGGYSVSSVKWSGNPADTAEALYSMDGVSFRYSVYWSYYESSLFDFKVCAQ